MEANEGESSQKREVKAMITLRSGKEVDLPTSKLEHMVESETEKENMEEMKEKRKGKNIEKDDYDLKLDEEPQRIVIKEEIMKKHMPPPFPQALFLNDQNQEEMQRSPIATPCENFRSCENSLGTQVPFRSPPTPFRSCEMACENPYEIPPWLRNRLRKCPLVAKMTFGCKITSGLRNGCKITSKLRNDLQATKLTYEMGELRNELRKFRSPKPISQLQNEIHLRNFARCFTIAKPPASTRVPLRKLKLHFRSCEPRCKITSKLRIKLQIISKLHNHLQVVKSQIQLAKSKFKLAKWIIQRVNHLVKSTCAISDICNRLS
uniref:Uncharacterized protein n=1 Tax=Vitis vinifera TaxID=29760 RepID=A5BM88_VITVI|nr:hypothetical protein VITISV_015383 [Vitis vinifera]